jgi:lipopolysaccharide/colanic/teichoic acid biosynthesis glycosyltransferase
MRRLIDVLVALVVAILAAPVIALIALLIIASLGRPVLFRQERCGLEGRIFTVVKFRTMRAPAYLGEPDAPRTPPTGRFLRASSLDELPQLWNILRGDMSLIGPRPTTPDQVARYSDHERGRLAVRPGLTGWAQVNGRNAISWAERIELDLWYIANRSLALDLKILLQTALRVLRPRGVVGEGGINPDFIRPAAAPPAPHPTGPDVTSTAVPRPRNAATDAAPPPSARQDRRQILQPTSKGDNRLAPPDPASIKHRAHYQMRYHQP